MPAERMRPETPPQMPPNITLIGFMGAGKSTVGRLLARALDFTFVDTDALIEKTAGVSVPELFAQQGEAAFRARESAIVLGITAGVCQVIATGGGAPLRETNAAALRGAGMVVWLTVRPEIVVERTAHRAGSRPLLAGDNPLERVLTLLGERAPIYQRLAHRVVDTSDRPPAQIVAEIVRHARRWQSQAL